MTARRLEPDLPKATVLDLREGECDLVQDLTQDLTQVEGSVLVLDHAETAAEHDHVYQALLGSPQVSAVICLAVHGGSNGVGSNEVVRVRPAPSLAPADCAATLWIGHPHGSWWRPQDPFVRSVKPSEPSGLRQLIDALAEPAVVEAVVRCASTFPHSTANPGLALERASLHPHELRWVQDEAVTQLTDPDVALDVPREKFRAEVRGSIEIDRSEEILVADSELATARARALSALDAADQEITRLDHRLALFLKHRPGQIVGVAVEEARVAAREFHQKVARQLQRIDGNLRGQRVTSEVVTQLGVRPPAPARSREIRDVVRDLVERWLGQYRSIAQLIPDLDAERTVQEPQGCGAALTELEKLTPPHGPAPVFATWPAPALAVPLAMLTGVLAASGVAPVIVVPVLVLAWFAAGLLLLARQPTATGEPGVVGALPSAVVGWGLPVLIGWFLAAEFVVVPPLGSWSAEQTGLAVLIFLGTVALSWRRAVRRWLRALDSGELRVRVTRTDQLLEEVLRTEWRPSARRAALAEGLRQASIGLTDIRDVLAKQVEDLFPAPGADQPHASVGGWAEDPGGSPDRDVHEEVREVVVTDLLEATIAALRPCWVGIEVGQPGGPGEPAQEIERLLLSYREHVQRHGLFAPPPLASDHTHRKALATQLWATSRVAGVLSLGVEDGMTQLCHPSQLGALSALAGGAQLVRFAPVAVREPVWDPACPGPAVTWTGESEIAGTLRLVPLREGVFS
jgi:hypothetical protein